MGRPTEARASIDEARKLDPNNAGSFVAEGLLFDKNGERDQARTAFNKAADLGSSNAYAYYRSAVLKWPAGPQPDQQVLKEMETALSRATELNGSYADAYASLAEVRAALRKPAPEVLPLLVRAVELEPSSAWHRLTAAYVFWRYDNIADARKAAQAALSLADTEKERAEAQSLLSQLPNEGALASGPRTSAQAAGSGTPPGDSSSPAPDPNALLASCQRGETSACTTLAPIAEKACADGQKRACLVVAILQARGSGVHQG